MVLYPKVLIEASDNVAISLTVVVANSNVTVHYHGRRFNTDFGGELEWKLTFFAEAYEKFSIDIVSNTLINSGSGISSICTARSCYQAFSSTVGVTSYFNCEGGCVNELTTNCQPNTDQYCGVCGTMTNCNACLSGCAFIPTTDSCTLCNTSSVMIFNGQCFPAIHGCELYTSPTVCQQCFVNYTGANCTNCSNGYFLYNGDAGGNDCGAVV